MSTPMTVSMMPIMPPLSTEPSTGRSLSPFTVGASAQAIADHLRSMFESDDWVCLTFIHAIDKTDSGASVTNNVFGTLSEIVSPAGIAEIQRRNAEGWNCYVAMNPLLPGSRRRVKDLAAAPRTVFMEVDEHGESVLAMVRAGAKSGELPYPCFPSWIALRRKQQ